jgi:hypothetical protein
MIVQQDGGDFIDTGINVTTLETITSEAFMAGALL